MNYELLKVKQFLNVYQFLAGSRYPFHYIDFIDQDGEKKHQLFTFEVESDRSYRFYDVKIELENHEIVSAKCNCKEPLMGNLCRHVAACLVHYKEEIFALTDEEIQAEVSKNLLEKYYEDATKKELVIKKQIFLECELTFVYRENEATLKVKIGENKLYVLNNKINQFFNAYETQEGTVTFGKDFVYDPKVHYFKKEDEHLLMFLKNIYRASMYSSKYLFLNEEEIDTFLEMSQHLRNLIVGYGYADEIVKSNPFEMYITKKENNYEFEYVKNSYVNILVMNCKYVYAKNKLYIVPKKPRTVLSTMNEYKLNRLIFNEEDLEKFTKGLLTVFKENVAVDDNLKSEIIIGNKPTIKIYLDIKNEIIICKVKLDYNNFEIDYFDKNSNIIRDEESEKEVLECLLSLGFKIDKKKIYMDDIENIGTFLEDNLQELALKYEVFTSNKIKQTNILKNNTFRSKFSIGKDNIMRFNFDLGNISNDEIVNILSSVKAKKKYYRLKSGDLINLEENDELKQLGSLVEEMDISNEDLINGHGEIPKYRAIYLDSVKKDKYNIIKTDNLFDELINKFNEYKNTKVRFSKRDKEVLRDYQEVGIKWLYNIYKCGFGGILADEMGLGKSIQLIYLIKEIIKEKKDAKILIIAPTSLIYNWQNEFNKFGKELSFKVVAENKEIRKAELENIRDVNIIITTYGLVRRDKELYLDKDFELVAIDEAQNIKNVNAQMTKVVKELHANTKLALTGTPLENSVLELWSIFDFIMPGYLTNIKSFNQKYNIKDIDNDNLKMLDNLNRQIKPFIMRRKKKDVIKELPPKLENNIFVELDKEQKKVYVAELEKTKKELDEILANEGFTKGNFKILQLLMKLRQVCIDPRIVYEDYAGKSSKIENLVSIVKDIIKNGHKILLFTSFKTAIDIVNREFTNNNISTYVIDGSVPSKKRMELVEKFNSDDTNVFLITLKSGGTGLNLTSADVVIHLDLWWNPQVENQATDRAHRIGQTKTVEVIKLICSGTIEERILELQNKKKVLSDKLIEGEDRDVNIISKLSEEDVKRLLTLDNNEE